MAAALTVPVQPLPLPVEAQPNGCWDRSNASVKTQYPLPTEFAGVPVGATVTKAQVFSAMQYTRAVEKGHSIGFVTDAEVADAKITEAVLCAELGGFGPSVSEPGIRAYIDEAVAKASVKFENILQEALQKFDARIDLLSETMLVQQSNTELASRAYALNEPRIQHNKLALMQGVINVLPLCAVEAARIGPDQKSVKAKLITPPVGLIPSAGLLRTDLDELTKPNLNVLLKFYGVAPNQLTGARGLYTTKPAALAKLKLLLTSQVHVSDNVD